MKGELQLARKKIPEDYEANKQKIIQASIDLMVKDSTSKFNLNKVANRIGITKAAIYWYYPSKDALLEEIAQTLYKRYANYASDIANSDLSPTDKLRNIMTGKPDTYESQVMGMFPVKFFLEFDTGGHTLKALVQKGYADFYQSVEQIIQEGIEKGEFRTDLSAYDLTVFISGAIDGLAFQNILLSDDSITLPRSFILKVLEKFLL